MQCSYYTCTYINVNYGCENIDSDDATVYCYTTRIWDSNPYPGMVRLQGGVYSNEGRVEVYCNGQWGTICSDGFDRNNADTICKQLGYTNHTFHKTIVVNTSQPIWMSNMNSQSTDICIGTSNNCPVSSHDITNCTHSTDIFVECGGFII
jgi:hypothetical protein